MQKLNAIHKEILKKITPTPPDRARIKALSETLQRKVTATCKEQGVTAKVRIEGSVAKDTWLREEPEIDVFMRLSPTIPRRSFGEISLKIARKATENVSKQVERFAEHPYLEAFIDDVRLNIVPCYDVKPGEWLSATDRTPFHTDYVNKRLDKGLRAEVRLLKKFLKGVGAYGAEIKTGGFSGYLCELLLVHYKSFTATLQAFAGYTQRLAIDIESHYAGKEREFNRIFPEPLVIVDPVDKTRNVASAVQPQKLYTLVAAARIFLKNPDAKFFYPPKITALTPKAWARELKNRGEALIFLPLESVETVPDVLWGQLYKTIRALRKLAELNDFKVLRDAVWSDEKTLSVFIFEFEQRVLPSIKKHFGPPLKHEKACEKFLSKHTDNGNVVSGPRIEDGRWVVELRRRFTDVAELLKQNLSGGGRNIGVAELMSQAFKEQLEVLVDNQVLEFYRDNSRFAEFLTDFLSGKPFWLKIAEG